MLHAATGCGVILHQMVHKGLQGDIVGENRLSCCGSYTAVRAGGVSCRWVELRQQKSSLRPASVTDDESRKRESIRDKVLLRVSAALKMCSDSN